MKNIKSLNAVDVLEVCGERISSPQIQTRLAELLEGTLPTELAGGPRIPLTPYLATPNNAVRYVLEKTLGSGIEQRLMTYKTDKFVSSNPEKAQSAYPRIDCLRVTKKGLSLVTEGLRLVSLGDLTASAGSPIGSLPTIYADTDLGTFYDLLSGSVLPELEVVDVSDALNALSNIGDSIGSTPAERYYTYVMAINQVYGPGVNIGGNEDPGFYSRVVLPGLVNACRVLGVDPIGLDVGDIPSGKEARKIIINLATIDELEQELGVQRI